MHTRRKILILASWYPSDAHPLNGVFIQDQAMALAEVYDVAVLTLNTISWLDFLKARWGPKPQVEKRAGLLVYRERPWMPVLRVPILGYGTYVRAAKRGLIRLIEDWGKPDLIHAHVVLPGGLAAVRLGKQYAIPVVLTEHTGPFTVQLNTYERRRLVRETLAGIDHLVAVSSTSLEQILAFQSGFRTSVIGNLVKTDFFKPLDQVSVRSAGQPLRFLAVALLRPGKGIDDLIHAAHLLLRRGVNNFQLLIGGDGPERNNLEFLMHSLGVEEHCRFLGALAPDDVRREMQQCDVFVLPSHYETFGLVYAEAMSCGKPVIGTRCGGPEFIVTPKTGVLVEVANPAALADAMAEFTSSTARFDEQHIRQSVVTRFGKSAFLQNISNVYDQILKAPKLRHEQFKR